MGETKFNSTLKLLTSVFKEVGLVGFIFVTVTTIFLIWGTNKQKEEFIDRFVLLKHTGDDPIPCVMVVAFLLMILVLATIYYNKMLGLRKEENNRLGKEKSRLQEILLEKTLHSSDENNN